jgi:hypothetical protein
MVFEKGKIEADSKDLGGRIHTDHDLSRKSKRQGRALAGLGPGL